MITKAISYLALSMLLFANVTARAEVPEFVNYQGRLLDGTNLVNQSVDIEFSLFKTSGGGTPVYSETQTVAVADGLYSTQIGLSNATPGALRAALTNNPVYLQIAVGGTPLMPRERLVAVPYAFQAGELTTDMYVKKSGDTMTGPLAVNVGADNRLVITHAGDSVMIGNGANASSTGTAVGATATGAVFGAAVGYLANGYWYGTAAGTYANASENGCAFGYMADGNNNGVAVGRVANGSIAGTAVGSAANGHNAGVAVGNGAWGSDFGTALGFDADGSKTNIAVGYGAATLNGLKRIAIGHQVTNDVNNSIRVRGTMYLDGGNAVYYRSTFGSGGWSNLLAEYLTAESDPVWSAVSNGTAIAIGNAANGQNSGTAVGGMANGYWNGAALGYLADGYWYGTAVGSAATGRFYGIAVGQRAMATNNGTAAGYAANGDNYGAAVGAGAGGRNYGAALGYGAGGDNYAVAIGADADTTGSNIAIGANAEAKGGVERIAIGHGVTNDVNNSIRVRGALYLDGGTGVWYRSTFGTGSWSLKTFVIDHPLDPENKILRHACLEGPVVWNVYAGATVLDQNGEASVKLPNYFEALNKNPQYMLTAVGKPMPNLHIKQEIGNNAFAIGGGLPGAKVCWEVKGERNDLAARENPLVVEETKAVSGFLYEHKNKNP